LDAEAKEENKSFPSRHRFLMAAIFCVGIGVLIGYALPLADGGEKAEAAPSARLAPVSGRGQVLELVNDEVGAPHQCIQDECLGGSQQKRIKRLGIARTTRIQRTS
jgi:hypothetical protein